MHIVVEHHTLGFHLCYAPIDEMLFHLEVRNAVAKQSTRFTVLLKHVHFVTCTGKLLSAC